MENMELADLGLRAFRAGDFPGAIQFLSELTQKETNLWDCRLYLAMAYCRMSQVGSAMQELRDIAEWCPDPELKEKAMLVLKEMNRQSLNNLKTLQSQKRKQ